MALLRPAESSISDGTRSLACGAPGCHANERLTLVTDRLCHWAWGAAFSAFKHIPSAAVRSADGRPAEAEMSAFEPLMKLREALGHEEEMGGWEPSDSTLHGH
ncbi:hypothetical protein AAFF_G00078170 [Aldrovandia affinis]|uniref:Uncharacterized protein n=1 Tax=Aldrovandia affinis TaxID=143900 RepID=A0AAD7WDS5_9TELE|nr:hypothetical protein AAFF_G00078170 [Aldrovandia affinis]